MTDNSLKIKRGSFEQYNNNTFVPNENTIYFAADSDNRTYLYLGTKNIVPKFIDLRNGGLGADLTAAEPYAVYLRGSGVNDSTYVNASTGAFYTTTFNNIVQKPQFGTLPVSVGGTGKTSVAKGAILYGNTSSTTSALSALSPTTNGYVLVSTGENKAPAYVKPTMSWTDGSTNGPIFNFTFNTKDGAAVKIAGAAIPAATDSISGIVTTGAQTMTGEKTWMSTTKASSIYPRTSNQYSLGSTSMIWNGLYTHRISIYDSNKNNIGTLTYSTGSETARGFADLTLGNNIASGTISNSAGRLCLFGPKSGYSCLQYVSAGQDVTHTLPASTGNVMISRTVSYNTDTASMYQIPFYITTGDTMSLGYNDGLTIHAANGTESSTTPGRTDLWLGNATAIGTTGNKQGKIFLFGDNTGYTVLQSNKSNGTSNYIVSLPAADGELVYHTEDAKQGGSGRLIYVAENGQICADSATDIAGSKKLMYLVDGLLTASTAAEGGSKQFVYLNNGTITKTTETVGSGTKLMYMSSGTLSESSDTVAGEKQLMYLKSGVLTPSAAGEGNNTKFVYLKSGSLTASTANIGSGTQLMYLSGGTFTASTADVGSATQPVYLLDGVITPANAYSTLLTAFSGSDSPTDNTASITVGGTTKHATIIGGVSNTWVDGTSSGPTLSTTVNGKTGSAEAIPSASWDYSGVITTGAQTLKGIKTFGNGLKIAASGTTSDCATFSYDASTDTLTISFP